MASKTQSQSRSESLFPRGGSRGACAPPFGAGFALSVFPSALCTAKHKHVFPWSFPRYFAGTKSTKTPGLCGGDKAPSAHSFEKSPSQTKGARPLELRGPPEANKLPLCSDRYRTAGRAVFHMDFPDDPGATDGRPLRTRRCRPSHRPELSNGIARSSPYTLFREATTCSLAFLLFDILLRSYPIC